MSWMSFPGERDPLLNTVFGSEGRNGTLDDLRQVKCDAVRRVRFAQVAAPNLRTTFRLRQASLNGRRNQNLI